MIKIIYRAIGPAIPAAGPREALRAGLGAFVGLVVAGVFVLAASGDVHLGLYLIAPFGASAVLIFAVPNSPLAQPWSAVMGNSASAAVAIIVCALLPEPALRIPAAVGAAIVVMILLRAVHPPGGAVAMTVAMGPELIRQTGLWFALTPVAFGTAILVVTGILYARATGRHYPFRQFDSPGPQDATVHTASRRIGLSEEELTELLTRYRQSLNLGVEDLARLIVAAETKAAGHRANGSTAADIMSRDLVTVGPEAPLQQVADLFMHRGFTALPVVAGTNRFLGVIYQMHLLGAVRFRPPDLSHRLREMVGPQATPPKRAAQIMARDIPTATPDTPVAALLPKMADGTCDAVPVLSDGCIVGIVTRTDLIAALARSSLAPAQG